MLNMYTVLTGNKLSMSMSMSKQTEDAPKQFKREYIWVFFGKFRVVSICFGLFTKQFCLFRLFRYRFETPKQTEIFCFWFHETNRNKPKQTRNRSCFGLFRFGPKIIFVCFEDTLVQTLDFFSTEQLRGEMEVIYLSNKLF